MPALKIWHIMSCTNSTKPPEISMPTSQMGEEALPDPQNVLLVSGWGSRGICEDQCWFDLPWGNQASRREHTNTTWQNLIEGASKCMISKQEDQVKFNEYCDTRGPHYEVYADGSETDERVGVAAVINSHFQNGEITGSCLSKRLPDNSTAIAAEATAITLGLDYNCHTEPVQLDVVVYSDAMACLKVVEWGDSENPLICYIMNRLWLLSVKSTHVRFCWIPSHCGIEGNEKVDQLAKDDIDPLARVHYADLKPLIKSYIQQLVQIKWDVSVHGRDVKILFCWSQQ